MAKNNELISSITHGIAFLLSIAALVLLIIFAAIYKNAWYIVTYSIFGSSMILLYLGSTIYHFKSKESRAKKVLQKIDHSLIYILIAGTYTPITLVGVTGAFGWTIFGISWGLAILGIVLKQLKNNTAQKISMSLYLIMGWLIIIALPQLKANISTTSLMWLVAGGISYTIGSLFYYADQYTPQDHWYNLHDVFHLWVICGSICHFFMLMSLL